MINNVNISKSFYTVGKNLTNCFACKYCRAALVSEEEFSYDIMPTDINKNFSKLPVTINLYYGDPLLQIPNTYKLLSDLNKRKHKGPVVIITKGDLNKLSKAFIGDLDLDLHFAFSTFGVKHAYDNFSHMRMIENMKIMKNFPFIKSSIEFRPICYGINDSREIIESVFKVAERNGVAIGYSGLQGKPETQKFWELNKIKLEPYPGFKFGHKKSVSNEVQDIFDELSYEYGVPIFRKTSCLISHVHGLERDYNAHYYRPSEMNCECCAMKDKCFEFKSNLSTDKRLIEDYIPFDFEIVYKEKHECILKKKGICEFTTDDCSNINGNIIKIDKKLTTADVRVIKWLTGYTVDADFEESQYLSDEWKK
jgi:hypothetical protein